MSYPKLAIIDWVDSQAGKGWTHLEEYIATAAKANLACRSVGWVLKRTKQDISLVAHYAFEPPQVQGDMTIPIKAIKRITYLKGHDLKEGKGV